MSAEDCRFLIDHNQFRYKDQIHNSGGKLWFNAEFYTAGTANITAATCSGASFKENGEPYPNHVRREIFVVVLREKKFPYNSRTEVLDIPGKTVTLDDGFYEGTRATYVWKRPKNHCPEGGEMREIKTTNATIFQPTNLHLNDMLIIKDFVKGVSIGLQVKKNTTICDHDLHPTQSQNIYLNILENSDSRENWQIQNLKKEEFDNEVDVYTTNLASQYISFNRKLSSSVREVINKKNNCVEIFHLF